MININNLNITTNQVNNININLQKMMPIRATFEIKDQNSKISYNQNFNIDIEKPNSVNNSFTQTKSPNNFTFSKNIHSKVSNPYQQRSISPFSKGLFFLKKKKNLSIFLEMNQDLAIKVNNLPGKARLRSSSPAQSHGNSNNEEKILGSQKPKWKF
jgi:hypothetical protein